MSPTKSEVHVLNEEALLQWLQEKLLSLLSAAMTDRSLLDASSSTPAPAPRTASIAQLPQHLVRTDSAINTIDSYLPRMNSDLPASPQKPPIPAAVASHKRRRVFHPPLLTSIETILRRIESEAEPGWEQKLAEHFYVGRLDHRRALLQFGTSLSVVDLAALSEEFFFQITLRSFGYHGSLRLDPPPSVSDLVLLGLQARGTAKEKRPEMVKEAMSVLMHWREMLSEYFSITMDADGKLLSLPLLLESWTPDWRGLPHFLLRLAIVDFREETRALESVAIHIAHLYRYTKTQPLDYASLLLLPAVRDGVLLPKRFFAEGAVVQLTSVEQLYKVFERC